jgi:hypothetical protein
MRLALPDAIKGVPIRDIQAYDCSETANIVRYAHLLFFLLLSYVLICLVLICFVLFCFV